MKYLIICVVLLAACGPIIEQEVHNPGCNTYLLETSSYYTRAFKPNKLLSYQLVYFNHKFDLESHGACDIWFTRGPLTDSIKSAQKEFAENKVREYKNMME